MERSSKILKLVLGVLLVFVEHLCVLFQLQSLRHRRRDLTVKTLNQVNYFITGYDHEDCNCTADVKMHYCTTGICRYLVNISDRCMFLP